MQRRLGRGRVVSSCRQVFPEASEMGAVPTANAKEEKTLDCEMTVGFQCLAGKGPHQRLCNILRVGKESQRNLGLPNAAPRDPCAASRAEAVGRPVACFAACTTGRVKDDRVLRGASNPGQS